MKKLLMLFGLLVITSLSYANEVRVKVEKSTLKKPVGSIMYDQAIVPNLPIIVDDFKCKLGEPTRTRDTSVMSFACVNDNHRGAATMLRIEEDALYGYTVLMLLDRGTLYTITLTYRGK